MVKPKTNKPMPPTVEEELKLLRAGHHAIAGVDEVGRGCWAGPVVAAAVVLPQAGFGRAGLLGGGGGFQGRGGAPAAGATRSHPGLSRRGGGGGGPARW